MVKRTKLNLLPVQPIVVLNTIFLLALFWIFANFHLPGNSLFWNALQNSGHSIAFLFATVITLQTVVRTRHHTTPVYLIVLSLVFLLGVLIEVVQHASGRGASIGDLIRNLVGIAMGTCIFILVNRYKKINATFAALLIIIIMTLATVTMYKPAIYVAERYFAPEIPLLTNFDHIGSSARVVSDNANLHIAKHNKHWPSNNSRSAKVTFKKGKWTSMRILEPHGNWNGYEQLTFQTMNNGPTDMQLVVRVDDWSIDHPDEAFMSSKQLIPVGSASVNISLAELAMDAKERGEASFDQIKAVVLYMSNIKEERTLYIDEFSLK